MRGARVRSHQGRSEHGGPLRRLRGCPSRVGSGFEGARPDRVESVVFDVGHVCARLHDGSVRCLGENTHGELGAARRGEVAREPVTVAGLSHSAEVIVGRRITCARSRGGTVRCIGSAESGQLGTGSEVTPDDQGALVPVQGLSGATQLSTSLGTTCARVSDGTLRCWGREGDSVATPVRDIRGLVEFDLEGLFHGCGRFEEGSVRCGRFARSVSVSGATQLDAGATHACARIDDGTVRCWGFNSSGQLGTEAPTPDAYTPVDPGVRCVTQVAVGGDHTCALITDGSVRCWGGNHFGQLGDGTMSDRAAAAPVAGVRNVVRLFAGAGTTCAVDDEGELACWGQSLWLPGRLPSTLLRPAEVRW